MKYILLKLTNGEFVKISTKDVVAVCIAGENKKGELLIENIIKIPELDKIVEYPQHKQKKK
jgi:hypothetical protein